MTPLLLALAVVAGVALGMLGGGGSILLVPLLVEAAGLSAAEAIAMSLLVVLVTSAAASVPHALAGRVQWRSAGLFAAGAMPAAYASGQVGATLDQDVLLTAFVAVMLAAAGAMLGPGRPPGPTHGRSPTKLVGLGLAVGATAGLVGAGGGFLIVPAMALFAGLAMPDAVATSLVVIALQSAAGLAGHLGTTSLDAGLAAGVAAATVTGSILGARLAGRVDAVHLRRVFAVLVAALAGHMAATVLPGPSWVWVPAGLAVAAAVGGALHARRARQPATWATRHRRAPDQAGHAPTSAPTPTIDGAAPTPRPNHHQEAVMPPFPHVPDVSPAEARELQRAGAMLVDVREPFEFAQGHAPGAVNVPLSRLDLIRDLADVDRSLVVVCRSGSRSASATRHLRAWGYGASNMGGGMIAWSAQGLPLAA